MKSVVKPEFLRKSLLKGTLISSLGLIPIFLSALTSFMTSIGFILGLSLIIFGLIPYKKLSRLQLHPHELKGDDEYLLFLKSGKPLLKIPKKAIDKIEYFEAKRLYGIGFILKRPLNEKIKILQSKCSIESFILKNYDLFLPYFLKASLNEIKSLVYK